MYYVLVFYPQMSVELSEAIDAIRHVYDPTSGLIKPHVTVIFPVPDNMGQEQLVRHIRNVLSHWSSFTVRLGGLHRSRDHWLFLMLTEGQAEVQKLYQALHTGILATHRTVGREFVPHLGLGMFKKQGAACDWRNPRESDFDPDAYARALTQARALPLASSVVVDTLHLLQLADPIVALTGGKMADPPKDSRIAEVCTFTLESHGA